MSLNIRNKKLYFIIVCIQFIFFLQAQESIMIDKIIATVGASMIKESDIQNQLNQMKQEGFATSKTSNCIVLEELVLQRMLIEQAAIDSIEVSEADVDNEIKRRIDLLAEQIGSFEKLEKFYDKSILEIKTEWRDIVKNQLLAQRMQQSLIADIIVSPNEVRSFYESFSKDSLPIINAEMEMSQIQFSPRMTPKQKIELKAKLEEIRERAINGESFSALSVIYSDDLASSKKGGDLGYVSRGELVPEFAAAAFKLKPGEISRIVESEYGLHIIKMIDRKGEKVNVQHILLKPKPSAIDMQSAKKRADSVYTLMLKDTIQFGIAAKLYSDDTDTKNNGGVMVNPYSGTSKFSNNQIDPIIQFELEKLSIGGISKPFSATDNIGNQVFKIVKLISKLNHTKLLY
ncbi:MAG: peptidylprolyl isomerase [Bacteroidales bacterium]|nr:peptidylprolyl isomerase [Bacteroidales bacterium]